MISLLKSFQKNCKKNGPQRVPPCRPLHVQLKIGISTCNKKTTFLAQLYFFPPSLVFLIVAEWCLIVILTKAYQKNRGSQSESNEDPIRAYQKREDLSKPYRSLGEELGFSIYYCKADPPKKKKKKIGGDPPLLLSM